MQTLVMLLNPPPKLDTLTWFWTLQLLPYSPKYIVAILTARKNHNITKSKGILKAKFCILIPAFPALWRLWTLHAPVLWTLCLEGRALFRQCFLLASGLSNPEKKPTPHCRFLKENHTSCLWLFFLALWFFWLITCPLSMAHCSSRLWEGGAASTKAPSRHYLRRKTKTIRYERKPCQTQVLQSSRRCCAYFQLKAPKLIKKAIN